jgi:hypothetical protein
LPNARSHWRPGGDFPIGKQNTVGASSEERWLSAHFAIVVVDQLRKSTSGM